MLKEFFYNVLQKGILSSTNQVANLLTIECSEEGELVNSYRQKLYLVFMKVVTLSVTADGFVSGGKVLDFPMV